MIPKFEPFVPDLSLAKRFLQAHGPADDVLQCGITGSHIYGFASSDSDIDIKGIHIAPTELLLTLNPDTPAYDRLEVYEGTECDLTTHEIAHALVMLLKGNGNVLERILSPYQLVDSAESQELMALARASVHMGFYNHYAGYFRGMQREHLLRRRAKSALYTYRAALTGIHLLRTGELVTDVRPLAHQAGLTNVANLAAFKSASAEKESIPPELDRITQTDWSKLQIELEAAREISRLPEEAPNQTGVEEWLLALRRTRWT